MSTYRAIADATHELRRQILQALRSIPEIEFSDDNEIERIVLAAPRDGLPQNAVVSLYLYQVELDALRRNEPPRAGQGSGDLSLPAPFPIRLHYLLTPIRYSESDNQMVLGRVLTQFHEVPLVSIQPTGPDGAASTPDFRAQVTIEALSLEQMTQLWTALSMPFRVSLPLLVEGVLLGRENPERNAH